MKVAPKIAEMFNATRAAVLKELEPILARRRAEEERKKLEAEKLELAKKAADADAEKKRLEVEKLELAKKGAEVDAERKKLEAELALAKKAAADAKREAALLAEAQAKQRAKEEEDRRRMQQDRPEKRSLVIKDEPKPTPEFVPTVKTAPARVPVAPFVFGGLAVAAGVVAGVFGTMSTSELNAARTATFQSDTVHHLNEASRDALVANIGFGVAGGAALAAIISIFVGREAPPPAPALQETP